MLKRQNRVRVAVAGLALLLSAGVYTQAYNRPAAPAAGAAPAAPAAAEPRIDPQALAVLNRFIEVTGGRAAYEAIRARELSMTMEFVGQAMTASMRIRHQLPSQIVSTTEITGMGVIEQGMVDGIAWTRSPMEGLRLIEGRELEQMRFQALSELAMLDPAAHFSAIQVAGVENVAGRPATRITLEGPTGQITQFYDNESGLLVRMDAVVITPQGDIPTSTMLSDYREVGGLRFAHVTEATVGPMTIRVTVNSIQINPTFPAGTFSVPEDVRALRP